MRWFKKTHLNKPDPIDVQVEPHEHARKEAYKEANKVNKHLNNLLVENGFHIKLYVATGGTPGGKKG